MLHEISPDIFDNSYIASAPVTADDYVLCFYEQKILLRKENDNVALPHLSNIKIINEGSFTHLFIINNTNCFLFTGEAACDENFIYEEISLLRNLPDKTIVFAGAVGFQLMQWYATNRFCGKCGSKTEVHKSERAIICNVCNHAVYPKISPAVIVTIIANDKILLAHNGMFRENFYSLVAGYLDIGESLEEAVIREVKEEVGLDVKNIRYYKSQPWPFSGSVMIGYFAEADENQKITPDNKEIMEAAWFTRDNLPNHPTTFSIAGEMIELFKSGNYH